MKILNKLMNEPWAITADVLQNIFDVALKHNQSPEAIAREMRKTMRETHLVSIRDGVAIIPVHGPLFRYANIMTTLCGATSYEILARDFTKALENPDIIGVVFDVDSPGGEVNGCSELSDLIWNSKAKFDKPVIAYASGACCSGAYWIASACDEILAADTACLGSVGVVAVYQKEKDKKCIEIVSSQSPNKRLDVSTEDGKAKIQARIDALADVFISKVARNLDISPEKVIHNFGEGDIFIGKQAVDKGLAHRLGSLESIIADLNFLSNYRKGKMMNEIDVKQQERERMKAVFNDEITKGREKTAQTLLSETNLDASEILSILATVPITQSSSFDTEMAKLKNPEVVQKADTAEENPEAVALRIASHVQENK